MIQKPLELVGYFHERMGHQGNNFTGEGTAQASELLETVQRGRVRSLIDYAVAEAPRTNYPMQLFGAVLAAIGPAGKASARTANGQGSSAKRPSRPARYATAVATSRSRARPVPSAVECPHDKPRSSPVEGSTGLRG